MKVHVYKMPEGKVDVMVEASPGKGRAPVVVQGLTGKTIVAAVRPLVDSMRRPKGEQPPLPS